MDLENCGNKHVKIMYKYLIDTYIQKLTCTIIFISAICIWRGKKFLRQTRVTVLKCYAHDSLKSHVTLFSFENKVMGAAAKVSLPTVYQKHSSLRTRKRMYRG